MAAPKRNPLQRAEDRYTIERLYLKGYTCRQISEKLSEERPYSLSHVQIGNDIKKVIAEWVARRDRYLDDAVAKELEKVNHIERTAWEAWERSIGTRQIKSTRKQTGRSGEATMAEIKTEDLNGDPRYIQIVQWCVAKRCEILGLDAPVRVDATVEDKRKPNLKALNNDELKHLRDLIGKARSSTPDRN